MVCVWFHNSQIHQQIRFSDGASRSLFFSENLCGLVLDTHPVQSDGFPRHFILPRGTLEPCWVAAFWLNVFLSGIDFQRGKVTCQQKKHSLLLPGIAACGQVKVSCCSVYKKAGIEISHYWPVKCWLGLLRGQSRSIKGERAFGLVKWKSSLVFSCQGLCESSIFSCLYICLILTHHIKPLFCRNGKNEDDQMTNTKGKMMNWFNSHILLTILSFLWLLIPIGASFNSAIISLFINFVPFTRIQTTNIGQSHSSLYSAFACRHAHGSFTHK